MLTVIWCRALRNFPHSSSWRVVEACGKLYKYQDKNISNNYCTLNLHYAPRFRFIYQSATLLWLFNDAVGDTNFTASSCLIVSELQLKRTWKTSGRGLIWGTLSAVVSSDWGKPRITLTRMVDVSSKIQARYLPNTSQKFHDSSHYTRYSSSVYVFSMYIVYYFSCSR